MTDTNWAVETTWINQQLKHHEQHITGDLETVHVRAWSTLLRVPTNTGQVYFKVPASVFAYEVGLTAALAHWQPGSMPEVLGADMIRGWLLLADEGPTLRTLINSADDFGHWHAVLALYAELQMASVEHVDAWLALGLMDRRLASLPDQFEQLLADEPAMMLGHPEGLTPEQYRQLRDSVPQFRQMCQQLAAYGLPETLHHDDFHDANIFVKDGKYTLADWSDACVGHPFFTLLVNQRSIAHRLKLDADDPLLADLRDGYLRAWQTYAPLDELQTACRLANRVGRVVRALSWYVLVSALDGPGKGEHAEAVTGWLQEFLA